MPDLRTIIGETPIGTKYDLRTVLAQWVELLNGQLDPAAEDFDPWDDADRMILAIADRVCQAAAKDDEMMSRVAAVEKERDEARRERDEARAMLRMLFDSEPFCPICYYDYGHGHAPDCALAAALPAALPEPPATEGERTDAAPPEPVE